MKIVSAFRDYYDPVGKSGVDRTVVYLRTPRDLRPACPRNDPGEYEPGHQFNSFVGAVGFSGAVHPLMFLREPKSPKTFNAPWPTSVIFDREGLEEEWNRRFYRRWERMYGKFNEWYDGIVRDNASAFVTHGVPTFLHVGLGVSPLGSWPMSMFNQFNDHPEREGLILNPRLADVEFYRLVEPFQAFQSIAGFVSGVLGGSGNPTVEIGDRDKIVKAGFDPVISFRKEPSKKRGSRR